MSKGARDVVNNVLFPCEIADVVTTNFPNSSVNEAMSGTNYVTVNGVLLVRVSTHNSNDLAQRQKPDIYFYNDLVLKFPWHY